MTDRRPAFELDHERDEDIARALADLGLERLQRIGRLLAAELRGHVVDSPGFKALAGLSDLLGGRKP